MKPSQRYVGGRPLQRDPAILNRLNSEGCTGLVLALDSQHYGLVRWLLQLQGINTDLASEFNITALHTACQVNLTSLYYCTAIHNGCRQCRILLWIFWYS